MYVFEQAQAQKYGKIFLVFREIHAKVKYNSAYFRFHRAKVNKKKNAPASLRKHPG